MWFSLAWRRSAVEGAWQRGVGAAILQTGYDVARVGSVGAYFDVCDDLIERFELCAPS